MYPSTISTRKVDPADEGGLIHNLRASAILRAVAAGRVEMTYGCEPDMFIDGVYCCDQFAAHELARLGFVRPDQAATRDQRVRATLTDAGIAALDNYGKAA